jgi:hypothetical protein
MPLKAPSISPLISPAIAAAIDCPDTLTTTDPTLTVARRRSSSRRTAETRGAAACAGSAGRRQRPDEPFSAFRNKPDCRRVRAGARLDHTNKVRVSPRVDLPCAGAILATKARRSAFTRWRVSGQRTAHADEVRTPEHVFQANKLNPKLRGELRVRIRVVRNQLHVERLDQPEKFHPGIADPIEPSVRPTRPRPIYSPRLVKPAAPSRVSRSLTMSLPASAKLNVLIETATGLRVPSGAMTSAIPARVQASTSTVS